MMQAGFFEGQETGTELPEGLRYRSQLIAPAEEKTLIERVRNLPFQEFEFHGFKGKRRTVSFGWQYEFSGAGAWERRMISRKVSSWIFVAQKTQAVKSNYERIPAGYQRDLGTRQTQA